MRNHLWCPNDPRTKGIDDNDDGGLGFPQHIKEEEEASITVVHACVSVLEHGNFDFGSSLDCFGQVFDVSLLSSLDSCFRWVQIGCRNFLLCSFTECLQGSLFVCFF